MYRNTKHDIYSFLFTNCICWYLLYIHIYAACSMHYYLLAFAFDFKGFTDGYRLTVYIYIYFFFFLRRYFFLFSFLLLFHELNLIFIVCIAFLNWHGQCQARNHIEVGYIWKDLFVLYIRNMSPLLALSIWCIVIWKCTNEKRNETLPRETCQTESIKNKTFCCPRWRSFCC